MKIKKILSAFLVCVMAVCAISTVAFAAETSVSTADDFYTAVKDAQLGDVINLTKDVSYDVWDSIWNKDGVTINGNNHTLTVTDVDTGINGGGLFLNASNLTINDLKVVLPTHSDEWPRIATMKSGALNNVSVTGGSYAVSVIGEGEVVINNCDFSGIHSWAIENESRSTSDAASLKISNSTFDENAVIIRGQNTIFTGNTIENAGEGVNVLGEAVITGNDFGESTLGIDSGVEITIEKNVINNVEFTNWLGGENYSNVTVENNTLSDKALEAFQTNVDENIESVVAGLSGEGTAEKPYLINNIDELKWFRDDVNAGNNYYGKYVQMTESIDIYEEDGNGNPISWTPIGGGNTGKAFDGIFDGNGKTIYNLYINGGQLSGFFGKIGSNPEAGIPATIKNLTVENATLISDYIHNGVICGEDYTGLIDNCTVKGDIKVEAYWHTGIISGYGYADVNNCHVIGNDGSYISLTGYYAGGICGWRGEGDTQITNCSVTNVSISALDNVGGITGLVHYGNSVIDNSVENIVATGSADAVDVGLIGGYVIDNNGTTPPTISKFSAVSSSAYAGETDLGQQLWGQTAAVVRSDAAKIGAITYETLAEALAAAKDGETITLISGDTPISAAGSVCGKTVTITGSAVFDWSKGWLYVGRDGEGDATLIFENATIKAVESSFSNNPYGINVSAAKKNSATTCNGTVIFKNSDIQLSYLANRNNVTVDGGKLYVHCGFRVTGRLASETPDGLDGKATMDIINGANVEVNNHNGMGVGDESNGTLNVEKGATFNYTGASFAICGNGEFNNKGTVNGNLDVKGTLISSGNVNGTITKAADTAVIEISGGTYTQDVTNWCADGFEVVKNDDNTYSVVATAYVAQIDDTKYTSLQEALNAAVLMSGDVTVDILDDVDLTNVDWTPVTVSAPGYPMVTVNGNKKTITGLNDMLFAGTWAGKSGLVINDLTIKDSNIANDVEDTKGTVGVGAFIGYPQASAVITLNNCHLVDSTVSGGHWTGGLIGMAGGYAGNDGPVFMNLTIKDCSVTGSTITGKGSVGAIIGHAACNTWTEVVIEDTIITGNTITSTGSSTNKAGIVMGTIGAAGTETTVNGVTKTGGVKVAVTESDNTATSNGTEITTVYGRQGSVGGALVITGGTYENNPIEENVSYAAPADGFEIAKNEDGTYGLVAETPALPTATVTPIENNDLTFALNFKADEVTDAQLAYYGDWYADFVLTVNKDVTFNADGNADGWLSGQYDAWNENWVNVPFENVTLKAGESLKIMEYAAKLMGQTGLKVTYNDVYTGVQDFDCGVFFDEEFLAANPDLEVTLALNMYNPEDETEVYAIGPVYEFEAPVVEEKDIFGGTFAIINMEPTMEGHYLISIYSGIDSLNYKEVGFEIHPELLGYAITESTNTVYTSITVPSLDGSTSQVVGLDKVGNAYRMFGTNVQLPVAYDNSTIYYRAYAIDLSGNPIYGSWYEIDDIYTLTSEEVSE